jgi:hypothetical protein
LQRGGMSGSTQTRLGTATSRQRVTGFEGCPDFEIDTKSVGDVGGHDDSDSWLPANTYVTDTALPSASRPSALPINNSDQPSSDTCH